MYDLQEVVFAGDMEPNDTLKIFKQEDGDFILTITSSGISGVRRTASIEFCVPSSGGGAHSKLWHSLSKIWDEHEKVSID